MSTEYLRFQMEDEYGHTATISMRSGNDHCTLEPAKGPLIHLFRDDMRRLAAWLADALNRPEEEVPA